MKRVLSLLCFGLLACNSSPSEGFLQQFKLAEEAKKAPALVVHLGKGVETNAFDAAGTAKHPCPWKF